ncbi:hypothetical protein GH714_002345 [Hevea brasiliensis]|uniref:Protein kinase domain-containing protein n=1 Tax=Hevea brasiliensis TaxID=3981 RepID=A0A6A6L8D5_HEVBR|nr:hypothetical protein GH714_002345 [Hevea brasiliensis]
MLVYDYMENGSLDKRVFDCEESKMLSCEERIRILKDVALGCCICTRDGRLKSYIETLKPAMYYLKEMNGRLGDFGLARMHSHGQVASTTRVVGTVGYLAPEVVRSGRASAQTDVFGFGVLILEVMCGRRPIEEGKPPLVELANNEASREDFGGQERANEPDSEDMDAYLLQHINSKDMWLNYSESSCYSSHPTFEDIRKSQSSSMSFSWTNSLVDGRFSERNKVGEAAAEVGTNEIQEHINWNT